MRLDLFRQPSPPIRMGDLAPIREMLSAYQRYRRARGLTPSTFWSDKVDDGLRRQGFSVGELPAPIAEEPVAYERGDSWEPPE